MQRSAKKFAFCACHWPLTDQMARHMYTFLRFLCVGFLLHTQKSPDEVSTLKHGRRPIFTLFILHDATKLSEQEELLLDTVFFMFWRLLNIYYSCYFVQVIWNAGTITVAIPSCTYSKPRYEFNRNTTERQSLLVPTASQGTGLTEILLNGDPFLYLQQAYVRV